jgi:alkylhydroperoxidase/carboxymuconolactone decarboxylase family protein YurZ
MPAKTTQQSEDLNNPYGYSEMDWAAQLAPDYAAARAAVRRLSVGEDSALSVKVKELIVLGVLASRGLQYGVAAHMHRPLSTAPRRRNCSRRSKPPPFLGEA